MSEIRIDALLPAEMATRAEYLGVRKAEMPVLRMFMLAILAGAFIALGAVFATIVAAGSIPVADAAGAAAFSASLPYGVVRLLAGLVFSLGLILVVVGGAELFTGNNLIVMAWASGKVSGRALLRNWVIVYAGQLRRFHRHGGARVPGQAVHVRRQCGGNRGLADGRCQVRPGVRPGDGPWACLCNALVCMAVWLTYSARSTVDKIIAIIFPIAAFVAAGFEHSVANMYFIPYGLLVKDFDPAFTATGRIAGAAS